MCRLLNVIYSHMGLVWQVLSCTALHCTTVALQAASLILFTRIVLTWPEHGAANQVRLVRLFT